jgi:hypothetical protein
MHIRNQRYPDLGSNNFGRCFTCGSDCPNGECPRDCDQNGPKLTIDGKPMPPAWVALSHEMGHRTWFGSDENVRHWAAYWLEYLGALPERAVGLKLLQDRLKEYNVASS